MAYLSTSLERAIIIAEAGVNHNGSLDLAKKLVDVAADAEADFIKFQTFKTELIVSKQAKKADYQKQNTGESEQSQYDMIKKLELSFNDFKELYDYCDLKHIGFLSTAFDIPSIDFLDELGQEFFKIPSGEVNNKPYLLHIASKGKPVIISTGMSDIHEIEAAVNVLCSGGLMKNQISILHCNTEYPTPMKDVNLRAMLSIKEKFNTRIGYSDHTLGIEVPIAAVALGAEIIEKHFTLDRSMPGPDHKASLEPDELAAMVKSIRNIELALSGSGIKEPSESEKPNIVIARKSIHLACNLKAGTVIQPEHLIMKRPGDGIAPMEIDKVIGKICKFDLHEDHKLKWNDIEL